MLSVYMWSAMRFVFDYVVIVAHTHTDNGDIQVAEERRHVVSSGSSSTVEVNLRVDQMAMEPLERFSLRLDPVPGFELDSSTEVFIDELTIEIIDNDSEQKWTLSLHSSMLPSLPPFFIPSSCLSFFFSFHSNSSFLSPLLFSAPLFYPILLSSLFFLLLLLLSHFLSQTHSLPHSHSLIATPFFVYQHTYAFVHRIAVSHLFPSSIYIHSSLLPSKLTFPPLTIFFSSHSQMCHFSLTMTTMVIQRTFLKLDSKCNKQL